MPRRSEASRRKSSGRARGRPRLAAVSSEVASVGGRMSLGGTTARVSVRSFGGQWRHHAPRNPLRDVACRSGGKMYGDGRGCSACSFCRFAVGRLARHGDAGGTPRGYDGCHRPLRLSTRPRHPRDTITGRRFDIPPVIAGNGHTDGLPGRSAARRGARHRARIPGHVRRDPSSVLYHSASASNFLIVCLAGRSIPEASDSTAAGGLADA